MDNYCIDWELGLPDSYNEDDVFVITDSLSYLENIECGFGQSNDEVFSSCTPSDLSDNVS